MGSNKAMDRATLELTQKIQLHFPENISMEILKAWNGVKVDIITEQLEKIFGNMPELPEEVPTNKFYIIKEFYITVPLDYDAKKYLAKFAKQNKKKFYGYNDNITDQPEYSNPSQELIPGKRYKVIVWGIHDTMIATSIECLQLLKENKGMLVGAPGPSLIWQEAKQEFIKGKWFVSFDEKDKLWEDALGLHRVPLLLLDSDGDWDFDLGTFENDWDDYNCVVGFCDCESLES